MTYFWAFYFLLSFLISFSFLKLFSNFFLRYLFFLISLSLLSSVWFLEPGSNNLAPIISIIFLENTITENKGFYRLLRPLIATTIFIFILFFCWKILKKILFKN